MKKSEKRMILILVIITIVVIALLVNVRNKKNAGFGDTKNQNDVVQNTEEESVLQLEDGTKLNISDKLAQTKTFGNFEMSNIQLTEKDGESLILADVKNISETKCEMTEINITLLDKEGGEITTIDGVISETEPQATVQLSAGASTSLVNAYDIVVKIAE